MSAFEIPLSPEPQRFFISLAGVTYQLKFRWNGVARCWVLDIADQDQVAVLSGVPIITGADLLAQFEYLGIGGALIAQTDHDIDAVPTETNLGIHGHLFFEVP